jgi:hypothetical protein
VALKVSVLLILALFERNVAVDDDAESLLWHLSEDRLLDLGDSGATKPQINPDDEELSELVAAGESNQRETCTVLKVRMDVVAPWFRWRLDL